MKEKILRELRSLFNLCVNSKNLSVAFKVKELECRLLSFLSPNIKKEGVFSLSEDNIRDMITTLENELKEPAL